MTSGHHSAHSQGRPRLPPASSLLSAAGPEVSRTARRILSDHPLGEAQFRNPSTSAWDRPNFKESFPGPSRARDIGHPQGHIWPSAVSHPVAERPTDWLQGAPATGAHDSSQKRSYHGRDDPYHAAPRSSPKHQPSDTRGLGHHSFEESLGRPSAHPSQRSSTYSEDKASNDALPHGRSEASSSPSDVLLPSATPSPMSHLTEKPTSVGKKYRHTPSPLDGDYAWPSAGGQHRLSFGSVENQRPSLYNGRPSPVHAPRQTPVEAWHHHSHSPVHPQNPHFLHHHPSTNQPGQPHPAEPLHELPHHGRSPADTTLQQQAYHDAPPMVGFNSMVSLSNQQRKRLRISRACDECRRRKTRCDVVGAFPGEAGHPATIAGLVSPADASQEPRGDMLIIQPCMNCRRSGVNCTYSKRPLKRGPSKGYIKDLERRLNSLESQMVNPESGLHVASREKGKVRTEDRIVRLENAIANSSPACHSKEESPTEEEREEDAEDRLIDSKTTLHVGKTVASSPAHSGSTKVDDPRRDDEDEHDLPLKRKEVNPDKGKKPSRAEGSIETIGKALESQSTHVCATSSSIKRQDTKHVNSKRRSILRGDSEKGRETSVESPQHIRMTMFGSALHATFPILPYSEDSDNGEIARLEERVLVRGMRLLADPVEPPITSTFNENQRSGTPTQQAAGRPGTPSGTSFTPGGKKSHSVRVAQLVGQASAGFSPVQSVNIAGKNGIEGLKAARKVASRLAAQEADMLMLCYLDSLRHAQVNNSALAAAVAKLGSGSQPNEPPASLRRRTVIFMLDRWHSVAYNSPHLFTGRFAPDRVTFDRMRDSLGDLDSSPLGGAACEVLRAAIMFGQLHDLAQSAGGWKHVTNSDVESAIHSVGNQIETPAAAADLSPNGDAAMRHSLESAVRTYHALHTLPIAKDASINDVARIFGLCEQIVVLGSAKTPITPASKLLMSAIGPQVVAIAAIAFSWIMRVIARLAALAHDQDVPVERADRLPSSSLQPLEHYRRKTLDYFRMLGTLCAFSGGQLDHPGSFKFLYLRCALFFNGAVTYSSKLGVLLNPPPDESPAHGDPGEICAEADSLSEMACEMGFLGYVLACTDPVESWSLVSAAA
ncbi:hypothetical protein IE53DRAFT_262030 [Violaceomyces palustris]|uniref:Uncharacterized protein n=1 Tax=Violaceomyces palustris TaxID=1673888 RepID=A0ACD0P3L2_9BASI|nr:hypothetical protein IE53DRAFT_262030 [Violaceomyces palustris]